MLYGGEEGRIDELLRHPRPAHGDFHQFLDPARIGRQHDDPVRQVDRLLQVVGNEQDGHVDIAPDLQQVGLHLGAGLGIQRAEGFIHQQHPGLHGQRAGDGHALLHAPGQLVGIGIHKLLQSHDLDPLVRVFLCASLVLPHAPHAEHDIALHRQPGEQGVSLEDHATIRPGAGHGLVIDLHHPGRRIVQPGDNANERRFPAPRGPHNGYQFTPVNRAAHILDRGDRPLGRVENARQVLNGQGNRTLVDRVDPFPALRGHGLVIRKRQALTVDLVPPGHSSSLSQTNSRLPSQASSRSMVSPMMPIMTIAAYTLS